MLTNADCTLLLAEGNGHRALPVRGVHWEGAAGASLDKNGSTAANSVAVYIPFSSLAADALVEHVSGRDYILQGVVENFSTVAELLKTRKLYTLQRITKQDYGSPALQHWKVEAL